MRGENFQLAHGSQLIDAELKKVSTDKTVSDVFDDNSDWTDEDKDAFWHYLSSEPAQNFLALKLEGVEKVKKTLLEHGNSIQKIEALTWKNKCHWLQGKDL